MGPSGKPLDAFPTSPPAIPRIMDQHTRMYLRARGWEKYASKLEAAGLTSESSSHPFPSKKIMR